MRATLPARHLLRLGHEVDVVVVSDAEEDIHVYGPGTSEVHITRVQRGWRSPGAVTDTLAKIAPDVVHAIGTGRATFWPGLRYRQSEPATVLITDIDERLSTVYPFPKNLLMSRWESVAVAESDLVIVVSREMEKHFTRGHPSARLAYLPNAVDLETFDQYAGRADQIRQQLGEGPIVMYMGFMLPQYRTDRVLEVARSVVDARPNVRFILIGKGPERAHLESMTADLGLQEVVAFTGFIADEELPGYLSASDVLLFPIEDTPINRARCPNKTFVYCAAQVPIVTNPVGEVKNALGEHARYFDFDSNENFAEAIIDTLNSGQPRPPRAIAERHSWATRTREYVKALQSLECLEGALADA